MIRAIAGLFIGVFVAACADYQFTVNERVVYSPEPLFAEFDITDKALRDCVKQHIADGSVRNAQQLLELNCSHAGISDLAGLEAFTALQQLHLASNSITQLAPLATLAELSSVNLKENQVKSLLPLRGLEKLKYLNVTSNPPLVCGELNYFQRKPGLVLEIPTQCAAAAS
jgi:hypothetical protein